MSIYDELGVRPFINAKAPYTRYGGTVLPEVVIQAMAEASRQCCNMYELQAKAGQAIARLTSNHAAYISNGAASGLMLAIATCIAGLDEGMAERLPESSGMKNEIVMQACDVGTEADIAIRNAGGKIIQAGRRSSVSEADLKVAITDTTAAIVDVRW